MGTEKVVTSIGWSSSNPRVRKSAVPSVREARRSRPMGKRSNVRLTPIRNTDSMNQRTHKCSDRPVKRREIERIDTFVHTFTRFCSHLSEPCSFIELSCSVDDGIRCSLWRNNTDTVGLSDAPQRVPVSDSEIGGFESNSNSSLHKRKSSTMSERPTGLGPRPNTRLCRPGTSHSTRVTRCNVPPVPLSSVACHDKEKVKSRCVSPQRKVHKSCQI
jgi:hypothetical protein